MVFLVAAGMIVLFTTNFQRLFENDSRSWVEGSLSIMLLISFIPCISIIYRIKKNNVTCPNTHKNQIFTAVLSIGAVLFAITRTILAVKESINEDGPVQDLLKSVSSFLLLLYSVGHWILLYYLSRFELKHCLCIDLQLGSLVTINFLLWLFVGFEGARSILNVENTNQSVTHEDNDDIYQILSIFGYPALSEYAIVCMTIIASYWIKFESIVDSDNLLEIDRRDQISSNDEMGEPTCTCKLCPYLVVILCSVITAIQLAMCIFLSKESVDLNKGNVTDLKLKFSQVEVYLTILIWNSCLLHLCQLVSSAVICLNVRAISKHNQLWVSVNVRDKVLSSDNYLFILSTFGIVLYTGLNIFASITILINHESEFMNVAIFHIVKNIVSLLSILIIFYLMIIMKSIEIELVGKHSSFSKSLLCLAIFSLCNWIIDTFLVANFPLYTFIGFHVYNKDAWHNIMIFIFPLAALFRMHCFQTCKAISSLIKPSTNAQLWKAWPNNYQWFRC